MPDREKVIKGLEHADVTDGVIKMSNQVRDVLVALLKEQEAKPVIVTTNAYGTRFYHCPKCNRDLYVYPRQLYCSNCGQEVTWDA